MKKIREIFTWIGSLFSSSKKESWRVVLLCLFAATTFWVLNALNKNYTTKINYPIDFVVDNPNDVVFVKEIPEKIEIDVSGGGWNLLRKTFWFNISPVSIPLNDPAQVKYITGSSLVPIISDQLNEISLNYVVTDTLFFDIQSKIRKTSYLKVDSQNIRIKAPYRITSNISLSPDTATFIGPSSMVSQIPDTIYIKVPGEIEGNFEKEINLDVTSSELVTYRPEKVKVQFNASPLARETKVVTVRPLNFPKDFSYYILDDKVETIFMVQEKNLANIDNDSFEIIANFKNLDTSDSTIDVTLGHSPDFIYDLKVNPKKVRIKRQLK